MPPNLRRPCGKYNALHHSPELVTRLLLYCYSSTPLGQSDHFFRRSSEIVPHAHLSESSFPLRQPT